MHANFEWGQGCRSWAAVCSFAARYPIVGSASVRLRDKSLHGRSHLVAGLSVKLFECLSQKTERAAGSAEVFGAKAR
jgi:hypothetical protein